MQGTPTSPSSPSETTTVIRLRDLEIVGETVITTSPEKVSRLIIRNGARIFTHGSNITLAADEIISEEGVIDTTPTPFVAQSGVAGLSGGTLKILADKGSGTLHIISAGQSGGSGSGGTTGTSGGKGPRGNDAKDDYTKECMRPARSSWMSLLDRDPGGPGPCFKNWYCSRGTGSGGRGATGNQGGAGESGLPGGSTADVLVAVQNPAAFQVTYELRPGSGGIGGRGGAGGRGGPGGDPGTPTRYCKAASHGANGAQGPAGNNGPMGSSGTARAVCLRLGSAQIGDCNPFTDMTH